eukprot:CAMPEP_0194215134 /NCGR_PEP_ID=MMETSP0156-20130528/16686_1 /TAXON_ID=33649 /ORGANISM="Thalassionema nitzschioides, Strain L26-B" /LENGTH=169 /DNA_ID=CAMNT_0038943569 /DNA_START=43 /DNA_END=549 /DNA_ORIENTATION=-
MTPLPPPPPSSIPSWRKTILKQASSRRNNEDSMRQEEQRDSNAAQGIMPFKPLLPRQAQAKLHQSPNFRKAVFSFEGINNNNLVERAIEFDYMTQLKGPTKTKNNNSTSSSYGGGACMTNSIPLRPQQAQQRLDQSPNFRKRVFSFKGGNSNCLVERAIEAEYMTQLRS